jgi:hypothetical protein
MYIRWEKGYIIEVHMKKDRQMKPTIELKSVKVHTGLSEETPAYTARLFVDGKHFADVSNSGHGGCDMVYQPKGKERKGFYSHVEALEARIKSTYPQHSFEVRDGEEFTCEESLEGLCHALAWESVDKRNLKSRLSRTIIMIEDDKVFTIKGKKTPERVAAVEIKYPDAVVLNAMSFNEAYDLFKMHTA